MAIDKQAMINEEQKAIWDGTDNSVFAGMDDAAIDAYRARTFVLAKNNVRTKLIHVYTKRLAELARSVAGDDEETMEAVNFLDRPAGVPRAARVSTGPRVTEKSFLDDFMNVGDFVSKGDIFNKYELSPKDVHRVSAIAIRDSKDSNTRKWISIEKDGYRLASIGAEPDANDTTYNGYRPVRVKLA